MADYENKKKKNDERMLKKLIIHKQLWTVMKKIGKGGYGKVFLVDNGEQRRALKVLKLSYHRCNQELQISSGINHSALVSVYATARGKSHAYILMEFCQFGDLSSWVKRNDITEISVKCITIQILYGLQFLHDRRIAHRDIKLQNVLVRQALNDHHLEICLTDFGISSTKDVSQSFVGTRFALPPEIIHIYLNQDQSKLDYDSYKVDIWALGVLVFQLMVGRNPFDSESLRQMFKEQLKGSWFSRLTERYVQDDHEDFIHFMVETLNANTNRRPDVLTTLQLRWLFPRCNHEQDTEMETNEKSS